MAAAGKKNAKTVVVALGGNAILQPGQVGTFEEQLFNIDGAMRRVAQLVEEGWRVVLTHGNGPQVGNLLIQNALAARTVAPMPMDVCGAESQGQIGYMAAQTLANHLRKRRLEVPVVTIVTQVAVDPADKAFANPSKPVGPFYSEAEAKKMMLEEGLTMREDAGRGWRRVVPSPEPREIVELEAVRDLSAAGALVVCSGGGGVPVTRSRGALSGIDAVIDKDLAAALAGAPSSAPTRCSSSPTCPRPTSTTARPSRRRSAASAPARCAPTPPQGHFKAGSMGPKVEACLRFVDAGGESVIASLVEVGPAMAGKAGTHIVPDGAAKAAGRGSSSKGSAAGTTKARGKAAGKKKSAARKQTTDRTRRSAATSGGAEVIDITARRRAAAE